MSAFAFGGKPYEAVSRAVSEAEIWVSQELLTEYRQVPIELDASEKITRDQTQALVAGIAAFVSEAYLCNPKKRLLICRDPEDNRFWSAASPLALNCSLLEIVISWKFHGLLFGPRVSENCESSGQPATREGNSADAAKQG